MNRQVIDYIVARSKEPSTWRGLVAVLTALGVALKPEDVEVIIAAGMGVGGFIGLLFADKPKDPL
jgi:hypothetical protein